MHFIKLKYLAIIFFCFIINKTTAQSYIALKSFVKNNSIYLRWVHSDLNSLQSCSKEGYVLKRINLNEDELPDINQFTDLSSTTTYIKSHDKNNPIWKTKLNQNIEIGFLYNVLFNKNSSNNKNENYYYGLAMLNCDYDTSLANSAGLFFRDTVISKTKYAYLLQPKNLNEQNNIKPSIIIANAVNDDYLPNPDSLKNKPSKNEVALIWPEEKYKSFYTGYYIERSEDNLNFRQLNTKPYTQIKTKDDKNKTEIIYYDTTFKYNKNYYYRIRGLSFFGFKSNYSNTIKISIAKPITITVSLDSVKTINDSLQKIIWHTAGYINKNELAGFNIYTSENEQGPYLKSNKNLLYEKNYFIDLNPKPRTYYKVLAYNIFGDSTESNNIMAVLPDIKPPISPKNLKGNIDSSGIVKLNWLTNKEKDLKGYRLFRCNNLNEEPVEISTKILIDTTYLDKIDLNTLTENVIYFLTAVDNVFNNSNYSAPLILKRPDKIKPVNIVFKKFISNDSSITISWIKSTSNDVHKYELFQISNDSVIKIKEWSSSDSLSFYNDTSVDDNNYYKYKIRVTDNSLNYSENTSNYYYFSSQYKKSINEFKYRINKENKSIVLEWEAPNQNIFSYVLYKSKNNMEFINYKTFKNTVLKFEDKDLNIGNIYNYKIKAILNTGAETKLSKTLIIDF